MRRGQAGVGLRASPNLILWMSTLQHSAMGPTSKPRATATKTRFTSCDRHKPRSAIPDLSITSHPSLNQQPLYLPPHSSP
ncbi:hypothetical protein KC367_g94 [Hortaea werneckii]|nr:hypothetical protein KC367_g94 [Hortaea werneckii]